MKKILILPVLFVAVMWSCNSSSDKIKTSSYDSLQTNPHAVPSHVDTTTHEDGLHNQSPVPSDTSASSQRSRDSLIRK